MRQIPTPMLAAMRRAIADNQNCEPEDFLAQMDAALADEALREAIRERWLATMLQVADDEGGEYTIEEVRAAMTDAIQEVAARKATTS